MLEFGKLLISANFFFGDKIHIIISIGKEDDWRVHGNLDEKSPSHGYDSEGEESSSSSIVTGGAQTPPTRLADSGAKSSPMSIKSESSGLGHPLIGSSGINSNNDSKSPALLVSASSYLPPPLGPPPSHHHHYHGSTSVPAASPGSTAANAASMLVTGHHNHHLLYHPSQHHPPSEWYPTAAPVSGESINHPLNHFGHHHHHHHLVHPGAATAY